MLCYGCILTTLWSVIRCRSVIDICQYAAAASPQLFNKSACLHLRANITASQNSTCDVLVDSVSTWRGTVRRDGQTSVTFLFADHLCSLGRAVSTRALQFAIRIYSIRYANRFESIRFVKKIGRSIQ